jgi:DNA-binding CsgD family transcriptional regulator
VPVARVTSKPPVLFRQRQTEFRRIAVDAGPEVGISGCVPESTLTAAVALDAIDEGVVVQDALDRVVYANRAASELLGVDRERLRGSADLPDGWPGEGAPRVLRVQHPDGSTRGLRVRARPIGNSVLTSLQDVTAERQTNGAGDRVLSPREHQVVELLAAGLTGEQVAVRLGISPATVRVHIRNATAKLGASTRTQAVAIAVARGEVAAP